MNTDCFCILAGVNNVAVDGVPVLSLGTEVITFKSHQEVESWGQVVVLTRAWRKGTFTNNGREYELHSHCGKQ